LCRRQIRRRFAEKSKPIESPPVPTLFEKLNLAAHRGILVLNAPAEFEPTLAELTGVAVHRQLGDVKAVGFVLAFATRRIEVDRLSKSLSAKAAGDAVVWFAYPKGTSKSYTCDFNRDNGWDVLRAAGFDTVRAVAIDDNWSALRFRRVEFIKRAKS
jgi:hypothetical protein